MSSVEIQRSRLATQHNRWLLGCLGLAIAVHAAAAVALTRWNLPRLTQPPQTQTAIPLDFVDLEASSPADPPPAQTTRRAQTDSTAGQIAQPNQPVRVSEARPRPVIAPPPAPAALRPQPPAPPQPRAATRSPQPAASRPPSPAALPSPAADITPSSHPASLQQSPLAEPSPATSPGAAALGAPQTLSLEGIGQGNQLNANRLGTGEAVDATAEATWGTYLSGLNRLIDRHWQRVAVSATRRTRIQFRVNRQGQLTEWNVLESSGDAAADQAAIQAIRAAAPFAPLPQNASEEVLIVNFTFTQWLSPDVSP